MGFFAKLKNTLTGGWAKIKIECDGGLRGDEIQVVIRAFVGAEPIDIERVYLKVRSFEEVEIPRYQFQNIATQQLDFVDIEHNYDSYVKDYTVDGPQRLEANEEYEWDSVVGVREYGKLPENAKKYIARLEELVGTKIGLISTSPDRNDTIIR